MAWPQPNRQKSANPNNDLIVPANYSEQHAKKSDVDTSGEYGLSKINEANIAQGYAAGRAARNSPSPFNNYGAGTATQSTTGQIGDGNGISPFAPTTERADDLPAPSLPPGRLVRCDMSARELSGIEFDMSGKSAA
jgi:hypothetical protein